MCCFYCLLGERHWVYLMGNDRECIVDAHLLVCAVSVKAF